MAEIVRRRSWGGVLPLGRHVSISGSSFIQCASASIAPPHPGGAKCYPGAEVQGRTGPSTTVASILPVWSSPGRVWEGRSVDVCCGLVGVAGGLGTRVGGAQGADRTGVRQGRNTGDRRSFSRRCVVGGRAQNGLASG